MEKEKKISNEDARSAAVLEAVYKCGKSGSEAAVAVLKYVNNESISCEITSVLDGYQKLSASAAKILMKMGITPQEDDLITKAGTKISMMLNTMADSSLPHLAEILIQGANNSIEDLRSVIKDEGPFPYSNDAISMAEQGITFCQRVADDMQKYI